jgi:predicted transcriptional regulator
MLDILKVAKKGAIKTHIVYKTNLNFEIIKKYLKILIDLEMLRYEGRKYYTTEKGEKNIKIIKHLHNMFGEHL